MKTKAGHAAGSLSESNDTPGPCPSHIHSHSRWYWHGYKSSSLKFHQTPRQMIVYNMVRLHRWLWYNIPEASQLILCFLNPALTRPAGHYIKGDLEGSCPHHAVANGIILKDNPFQEFVRQFISGRFRVNLHFSLRKEAYIFMPELIVRSRLRLSLCSIFWLLLLRRSTTCWYSQRFWSVIT